MSETIPTTPTTDLGSFSATHQVGEKGITAVTGFHTPVGLSMTYEPKAPQVAPVEAAPVEAATEQSLILGKFKTPDDLAKAYQELEKKLGAPKAPEASSPAEAQTPEAPKAETPEATKPEAAKPEAPEGDATKAAAEEAGIPVSKYEAEWAEKGSLSEEAYKELAEKHGIPKDIVDDYISLRKSRAEANDLKIAQAAGGKESLEAALKWFGANASDADLVAYNAAIDAAYKAGNADAVVAALNGFVLPQFRNANPDVKPARIVDTTSAGAPGGDAGTYTQADFSKDVRSERYKRDAEFRMAVNRKAIAAKLHTSA